MGTSRWSLFVLLALVTLSAMAAGDNAEDLDADLDSDLDLDNLEDEFDPDVDLDDDEAGADGAPGGGPPVEDFDLGFSDNDKKSRMKSCFGFTVSRAQANRDKIDEMTQGLAQQRQISTEQAVNSILFSWAMTCYLNSDEPQMKQVQSSMSDGSGWTEEYEPLIFQQRPDRAQQVQSASEKQWKLLESIVVEHSKDQGRPGGSSRSGGGGGGASGGSGAGVSLPGGSMSSQSSALYMLIVFGAFFGVGALVVSRLARSTSKGGGGDDKKSSGKSAKKAEKAEKALARKRNM